HLINKEAFDKMKDGVRVVNCARGGIIDEDDLYDALQSGKVAGAGLDVFEEEPAVDHKVLTLPQVIATPHLGASTKEAQENEAIEEININFSGDLTALEIKPLTQNTLKGLLSRHLGTHVNNVNAAYLAERKGITIHENKTSAARGFTNLMTVEVITKNTSRK